MNGCLQARVRVLFSLPTLASWRAASMLSLEGINPPFPATMIRVRADHGCSCALALPVCAICLQSDNEALDVWRRSVPSMSQRTKGRGMAFSM